MLVLCRKLGEKIHIGENIVVTVCEIDGNRVRLGVDAPRDIAIYRQEILPKGEAPEHEHGGES